LGGIANLLFKKSKYGRFIDEISGLGKKGWDKFKKFIRGIWEAIIGKGKKLMRGINKWVGNWVDKHPRLKKVLNNIDFNIKNTRLKIENFVEDVKKGAKSLVKRINDYIATKRLQLKLDYDFQINRRILNMKKGITGKIKGIKGKISGKFKEGIQKIDFKFPRIRTVVGEVLSALRRPAISIGKFFASIIDNTKLLGKGFVKAIGNIKSGIIEFGGKIGKLGKKSLADMSWVESLVNRKFKGKGKVRAARYATETTALGVGVDLVLGYGIDVYLLGKPKWKAVIANTGGEIAGNLLGLLASPTGWGTAVNIATDITTTEILYGMMNVISPIKTIAGILSGNIVIEDTSTKMSKDFESKLSKYEKEMKTTDFSIDVETLMKDVPVFLWEGMILDQLSLDPYIESIDVTDEDGSVIYDSKDDTTNLVENIGEDKDKNDKDKAAEQEAKKKGIPVMLKVLENFFINKKDTRDSWIGFIKAREEDKLRMVRERYNAIKKAKKKAILNSIIDGESDKESIMREMTGDKYAIFDRATFEDAYGEDNYSEKYEEYRKIINNDPDLIEHYEVAQI